MIVIISLVVALIIVLCIYLYKIRKQGFTAKGPLEAIKNAPRSKYIFVTPDKGGYIVRTADTVEELKGTYPSQDGVSYVFYSGSYFIPAIDDIRKIGIGSILKLIPFNPLDIYDKDKMQKMGKKYRGVVFDRITPDKLYSLVEERPFKRGDPYRLYVPFLDLGIEKCSNPDKCCLIRWEKRGHITKFNDLRNSTYLGSTF